MDIISQINIMWATGNNARNVTVRMEGKMKDGRQQRRQAGGVKTAWKRVGKINGLTMARERKV